MEAPVTFKDYLSGLRAGHDAKGDFVRLARSDPALPEIASWDELSAYIQLRRGFEAVGAGQAVWEDYEAKQRAVTRRTSGAE